MVIQSSRKQTTGDDTAEDCCPNKDPPEFDYADLFEFSIPGNVFAITSDKCIRHELNESFRKIVGKAKSAYNNAK